MLCPVSDDLQDHSLSRSKNLSASQADDARDKQQVRGRIERKSRTTLFFRSARSSVDGKVAVKFIVMKCGRCSIRMQSGSDRGRKIAVKI